jgi:hypothetical protein
LKAPPKAENTSVGENTATKPFAVSDKEAHDTSSPPSEAQSVSNLEAEGSPATPRIFTPEELAAWCKKESKPRAWGPEGLYRQHLPLARDKICKDRFTYRVKAFKKNPKEDWPIGWYRVAVVHLADSGATEEVLEVPITAELGWGSESITNFEIGDVDGDGISEVFVGIFTHEEGFSEWKTKLLTLKDGTLTEVPLPGGWKPEGIEDVDKDGLYDVMTNGPYGEVTSGTSIGGDNLIFTTPGLFLLHSLGAFHFSQDDELSIATIKKTCPGPTLKPSDKIATEITEFCDDMDFEPEKGLDLRNPLQLVCARLWGKKVPPLRRALHSQLKNLENKTGDCYKELLPLIETTPPLQLETSPVTK